MPLTFAFPDASSMIVTGGEDLAEWREKHRLHVPGYQWTPQYKKGRWDGTRVPGEWFRKRGAGYEFRCSRGLLPRLLRDFGSEPSFNIAAAEEVETFLAKHPGADRLRDYQLRAIRIVLKEGWGRIAYATNAGKGAVIATCAAFAARQGMPTLILCDEIAVFDALREEVQTWGGFPPALVKSGVDAPPRHGLGWPLTLAMVPTLARRLRTEETSKEWADWLRGQQMVLLDEADKASAQTWQDILAQCKHSRWRAGFSGSFPEDEYNDLLLDEVMGPILDRVKNSEMIERGVSARPSVEVHAFEDHAVLRPFDRAWWGLKGPQWRQLVYEKVIVYNERRHQFIRDLIRADSRTAIIVNRVDHGEALEYFIPESKFIDGSCSETERSKALDAFHAGQVRVLIVTKILDRGTNRLGHATDLIFASGEGSIRQTLQRIGRGLRRADGKEFLRLVDIVENIGEPGRNRRMKQAVTYLHDAARRRLEVYAKEGFDLQIVRN